MDFTFQFCFWQTGICKFQCSFPISFQERNSNDEKALCDYGNKYSFEVQTAPISDGVLPGTIRQLVLEYDLIINVIFCCYIFFDHKEIVPLCKFFSRIYVIYYGLYFKNLLDISIELGFYHVLVTRRLKALPFYFCSV